MYVAQCNTFYIHPKFHRVYFISKIIVFGFSWVLYVVVKLTITIIICILLQQELVVSYYESKILFNSEVLKITVLEL